MPQDFKTVLVGPIVKYASHVVYVGCDGLVGEKVAMHPLTKIS